MVINTRWVVLIIAILPIIMFFLRLDTSTLSWSPDTQSFVELYPYRQPLYGYFYNLIKILGFQESQISLFQILLLTLALIFLIYEVCRIDIPIVILFALVLIWWFPLFTAICSQSVLFISESLFYPLLLMMCALCLRFQRTNNDIWMLLTMLSVVTAVFLRSAALAVLPATISILVLAVLLGDEHVRKIAQKSLVVVVILWGVIPIFIGRSPWQTQTPLDRSGMVFLPRIVMIPASLDLDEPQKSQWDRLNHSFISAGQNLSCLERSLYESQLQEAVRYEIGSKLLLSGMDLSPSEINSGDWSTVKATYQRAFTLFKEAIRQKPLAYFLSTTCHFWGMVSAGTHVDTESRQAIYQALQQVDQETWSLAKFRTDYPLNRFDIPLKPHTEWVYRIFRFLMVMAALIGVSVSFGRIFRSIFYRRRLDIRALTWMLLTVWLIAHSLLIALSVYPDLRYVMANFIIQWTLLALSLDGLTRRWSTRLILDLSKPGDND